MTITETQPKTLRDHLQALGGAALIVGMTLLMLEILLRVIDPWGMAYFNDLSKLGNEVFTSDDERGYILPEGTHQFSTWDATIDSVARIIPETASDASCRIAILGDSVAFGYGVNDADVWVNQIADDLPDVSFINFGVPRYNSTNVLMTFETYNDYDAYLYLIINNDIDDAIDPETQYFAGGGEGLPYLVRYTNYAIFRGGGTAYEDPTDPNRQVRDIPPVRRFFDELDTLIDDDRIYLAAFELQPLTNTLLARDYDIIVLTYPPQRNSYVDYHLNAEGNGELGEQLMPLLEQMVMEQCRT